MNNKTSYTGPVNCFLDIDKSAKNVCFFYSASEDGFKKIIAYNPSDKIICRKEKDIEKVRDFYDKNTSKDRLICGYFSYDLAYYLFGIKKRQNKTIKYPYAIFYAYDTWQEFKDSQYHQRLKEDKSSSDFKINISADKYMQSFKKIKNYIKEGDIYQINLTHKLTGKTNLNSRELFQNIIDKNNVDFSVYMDCDDFQILSASPERFIKIEAGKISTFPIKGTVKRGHNKKSEDLQKQKLINSEKEQSELNMITDLLRNDLGIISKTGSVKVVGHRILKKCPSVWHTYSHIEGDLIENENPIDLLFKIIPGGSITGCPKKRAIEIIDEVEDCSRGIYTGNIGYFLPNGDADFNIAIRTVIKMGRELELQVGGGIVDDSILESEFEETLQKATSFNSIL